MLRLLDGVLRLVVLVDVVHAHRCGTDGQPRGVMSAAVQWQLRACLVSRFPRGKCWYAVFVAFEALQSEVESTFKHGFSARRIFRASKSTVALNITGFIVCTRSAGGPLSISLLFGVKRPLAQRQSGI